MGCTDVFQELIYFEDCVNFIFHTYSIHRSLAFKSRSRKVSDLDLVTNAFVVPCQLPYSCMSETLVCL